MMKRGSPRWRRMAAALGCACALCLAGGGLWPAGEGDPAAPDYGRPITSSDEAVLRDPSGQLELHADLSSGRVTVRDARSGYLWESNPEHPEDDSVSFGVNQERIQSQLLLSYKGQSTTLEDTSSAAAATMAAYLDSDQLTMVYTFAELGFVIPVQYRLSDGCFIASVPADDIRETGENILSSLSLLPFFGAGSSEEAGYILLPDGSGALIRFNNGKTNEGRLTLDTLYGDRSDTRETRLPNREPVLVPGFGLCHERGDNEDVPVSLFAYATDGAQAGTITTNVAGRETGYNYAYYTFLHRKAVQEMRLDRTWAAKARLVCDQHTTGAAAYQMRYFFQPPDQAGLSGMATACEQQLFGDVYAPSTTREVPLFLDLTMGVRVKENLLGIPYWTLRPLTTFDQAGQIAETLREAGIPSLYMRLNGIDADGIYYGKLDAAFRADKKLGGLDGFHRLQEQAGTAVYPEMELTAFTAGGNGVSGTFDTATDMLQERIRHPAYRLAAGDADDSLSAHSLLKVTRFPDVRRSLLESLTKAQVRNVGAASLGYAAYPDYSRSGASTIMATADQLRQTAAALSERGGLLLEAPTAVTLPYADAILHLPSRSSQYNLTDGDVPFLQMVVSGRIPYSAADLNDEGDRQIALLRSIETGSALSFSLMWASYEQVADTPADGLYAATFTEQRAALTALYAANRQALEDVYGHKIIGYRRVGDGSEIVYDNGTALFVNYGDTPATWRGETVDARSYAVAKGA